MDGFHGTVALIRHGIVSGDRRFRLRLVGAAEV